MPKRKAGGGGGRVHCCSWCLLNLISCPPAAMVSTLWSAQSDPPCCNGPVWQKSHCDPCMVFLWNMAHGIAEDCRNWLAEGGWGVVSVWDITATPKCYTTGGLKTKGNFWPGPCNATAPPIQLASTVWPQKATEPHLALYECWFQFWTALTCPTNA